MAADTIKIRHILGDTLKYENGLIDVTSSATRPELADASLEYDGDDKLKVSDELQAQITLGGTLPVGDVRRYVPGGILTDDNIDDAIDDAIAACHAYVTDSVLLNTRPVSVDVYVPAGRYVLSRRHDFPGMGTGARAPGLVCAGVEVTEFVVNHDDGEWVFTFGDETYSATSQAYNLHVGGFSVIGYGGTARRSGIKFYATYKAVIEDIFVYGFGQDQTFDKGWGIYFAGNGAENHQHLTMRNVYVQECMVGFYLSEIWQGKLDDCGTHGNHFFNVVVDNAVNGLTWNGGDFQRGSSPSSDIWHSGRQDSNIVTGWSYITGLGSGTGATCGTQSAGLCTVTGLSGLHAVRDRGRWLELIPTGASSANKTTVAGLYKIESVLSATSCTIRKGSNHTSQGSCDWQIRGNAGGHHVVFTGSMYDEGNKLSQYGFYKDEVTASTFVVRETICANSTYSVEADGIGSLTMSDVGTSSPVRLRRVTKATLDVDFDKVYFDDYSYVGLSCRDKRQQLTLGGPWRDSGGGRSIRVRNLVKELGACAAWDARLASSFTLATLDVNAWTDYVNGASLVYNNASAKPQYVAADGTLGACVQIVGGSGDRGMTATVLAANLPLFKFTGSIFAVLRLGSAADHTASGTRRIEMTNGATFALFLGLNDDNLSLDPWYGTTYTGSNFTASLGATAADTAAHAMVFGLVGNNDNLGPRLGMDFQGSEWTNGTAPTNPDPGFTPGANVTVNIAPPYGTNTDTFYLAFLACFPRALTEAEHRQLIDAARGEWGLIK